MATAGPTVERSKAVNIGVAAHITAASAGGPRFDASMTADDRSDIDNAIWLCQNCAKLVDNDPFRFTAELLRAWKLAAEATALAAIGQSQPPALSSVHDALTAQQGALWSVRSYGRTIADPGALEPTYRERAECSIQELTPFYVRLRNVGSGVAYTVQLSDIQISYDEVKHRPMLQIRSL